MSRSGLQRGLVVLAGLGVAALACFEEPTSPAQCPAFCPGGGLASVESLLPTAIQRDSSFRGYVQAHQSLMLLASNLPGVDSRPIWVSNAIQTRFRIDSGSDTTTGPIVVDSMKLTLWVQRRDTAAVHNLRLAFYQLPVGIDSATTLADLAPAFAGTPLRVVNVDSLAALPGRRDSITGDTVLAVDSIRRNSVLLRLKFAASQAGYSEADSGKLALGVIATGDSPPSVGLGSSDAGFPATAWWFIHVDSAGKLIRPDSLPLKATDSLGAPPTFDSFVFDAPAVTLDSDLTVGSVPSIRSLLHVDLPRGLRDSTQIIRATLQLVPAGALVTTTDSVFLQVKRLQADFGAKSPVVLDTFVASSRPFRGAPSDTVRIEMTTIFRGWQADTTAVTAFYLTLLALSRVDSVHASGTEASTLAALRFYSSRSPAFRPSIRLTYVPRVKFGAP
ncbi:MAG TPA: hypothetical protein VKO86_11050 [Gemmatimonadales bacterium]|nr:hypothetical protein [Gemmatimonadales bacterium]